MKAKTNLVVLIATVLAYWIGLCNASAYYDPGMQRWLNRDPIGERGGKNLFSFTANSPVGRVDRDGYTWVSTGRNPPGNVSTIVCKDGKPVPWVPKDDPASLENVFDNSKNPDNEREGYFCARKCIYAHEQSHINDVLAQNLNICVGVANDTTIANPDTSELLDSENRAHKVHADCLKKCKEKCPGSKIVNQHIKENSEWIANPHL